MARMDTLDVDVVIIGAGVAGATAAAHCAWRGLKVALLEAEETAGYHSTGRSAALWILNYGPPDVRRLSGASRAFFESPPEGFATAPLIHRRPVVNLAPTAQVAHLRQMIEEGAEIEAIGALQPGDSEDLPTIHVTEKDIKVDVSVTITRRAKK